MKKLVFALTGAALLSGCVTTGEDKPVAVAPPEPQFARTADGWLIPAPNPRRIASSAPAPDLNTQALTAAAAASAAAEAQQIAKAIEPPRRLNPMPIGKGVVALDPTALIYPERSPCQSVVLFSERPIQQADAALPKKWTRFLGHWGNGSWDGLVCHDLRVVDVRLDGTAEVVSMHAPYQPWGQYATAYTREARFVGEDKLLIKNGASERLYWIGADGHMRAVRTNRSGYVTAMLEKKKR